MFIEPKILKGFRDSLPSAEIEKRGLIEKIETLFRSFGFVPIDTPALEYAEILLGKGGGETEKQVYRFTDNGGRDVALRFDLTVPFARFVAEHRVPMPFKRYHIAKVWRGENAQRGRYREFTQCDFDVIGVDNAGGDFEILLMIDSALKALGVGDATIRVNHRGLFNQFLTRLGVQEKSGEVLHLVDKLAKVGRGAVLEGLTKTVGGAAEKILDFIESKGRFEDVLAKITEMAGEKATVHAERLALLHKFMKDAEASASLVLDPSITRGLDYYTGVVYETFLNGLPEIGSVCSGGRYDDLAGLYSKEGVSGVGASVGLDRLIAAQEALGKPRTQSSYVHVVVACMDEAMFGVYQNAARKFRDAGVNCEVLLKKTDKLAKQYILAEKKGAAWMVVYNGGVFTLRNLKTRENKSFQSAEEAVKAVLSGGVERELRKNDAFS
ncbi:MAG: histidine--tRNA ligase [Treponema sp.]|jgi:histidyl-tRNA synthetase|nr:histidine--tRNA ligase [Treponema sp.]